MTRDDVRAYYQGCGDREWARLATAEGSVEFAVTTHAIAAYLPPGTRVLDIGGGPGRYSLWLAERGHRVVLADLSPELLAIARDKVAASAAGALVEEMVEADACDLGRWLCSLTMVCHFMKVLHRTWCCVTMHLVFTLTPFNVLVKWGGLLVGEQRLLS
jgi:SAM-dependent methyltransferase